MCLDLLLELSLKKFIVVDEDLRKGRESLLL